MPSQANEPTASDGQRSSDGRYIKTSNGVITDTRTNLQWIVGPDRNIDYNNAVAWVRNGTVDGGGWRMPTRTELRALDEGGRGTRNIDPLFAFTG